MKEAIFDVYIPSVNDVKTFVDITSRIDSEVDVLSDRYTEDGKCIVVDGKSIMALFSVDLNRPVRVVIHGGEEEAEMFRKLAGDQFTVSRLK